MPWIGLGFNLLTHNTLVYVIDGSDAHELDDGVSIESTPQGDWIHVHVADPTAYIPPTHPLSLMAAFKSKSVYLPETFSAMLPGQLSDKRFNIGLSPFALTFSALLDDKGQIRDYKVRPSLIREMRQISYDDVNGLMAWVKCYQWNVPESKRSDWMNAFYANQLSAKEASTTQKNYKSDLVKLQDLTRRHLAFRSSQGALQGDGPSMDIKISPYPSPKPELLSSQLFTDKQTLAPSPTISLNPNSVPIVSPAHCSVAESMVIAGRVAALFCKERGIPAVYRGQQMSLSPSDGPAYLGLNSLIEKEKDADTGLIPLVSFINGVVPYLKSAFISDRPVDHFSMGLVNGAQGYMKVTSPLRRYTDMMLHWNIKAHLMSPESTVYPFPSEKLRVLADHCHEQERRSKFLSNASNRHWSLEWMRRREAFWSTGQEDVLSRWDLPADNLQKVETVVNYGDRNGGIARSVISSLQPVTYRALVLGQARYMDRHQVLLSNLGLVKAVLVGVGARSPQPGEVLEVVVERIFLSSRYLEVRPVNFT